MAKTRTNKKPPATQESWNNEPTLANANMRIVRCANGELGLNWANPEGNHTIGFLLPHGAQTWAESLVAANRRELTVRKVRTQVRKATQRKRKEKVTA